jgi:hypothetical protein
MNSIDIDTEEFWDAFTGSDFATCNDFITGIEGESLMTPSPMNFTHLNKDDNGESETYLTLENLKDAYIKAITNGEKHCGESLNLDDPDACFANIVLQYAIYGEVVFG